MIYINKKTYEYYLLTQKKQTDNGTNILTESINGNRMYCCLYSFIHFQLSPSVTLLHGANADRKENDNNAIPQDKNCSSKFRVLIILLAVIVAMLAVSLVAVVLRCNKRFEGTTSHHHTNIKYFFQISDTHLDIYYNASITNKKHGMCRDKPLKKENSTTHADNVATFGRVKCDSSTLLLQSLSNELQNVNKKLDRSAEFVLITGWCVLCLH